MNCEKQISFILQEKSKKAHSELLASLAELEIPTGYMADIITVQGGNSKAAAYNEGMRQSTAKYKIYVDEHIRVLDRELLTRIVRAFCADEALGILGITGTVQLPTDGIYQNARKRVGRILFGRNSQPMRWSADDDMGIPYIAVQAVDGCFMATQYDVPWREDLFTGDCFFDTAQAIELSRHGYKVGVLPQQSFSCAHLGNAFPQDERSRQVFLDEYSKDIYPLVTIAIPTYNRPEYCQIALESVLKQSYRNLEIFITDNSTNDLTEKMVQPYLKADRRLQYVRQSGGSYDNWHCARQFVKRSHSEYVNWLMDDDVFHPDKITKMMNWYLECDGVSLVTSYRQRIDAEGNPLPDDVSTQRLSEESGIIDGETVGKDMFCNVLNFIGEPTTVLIKKQYLRENDFGWNDDLGKEHKRYAYPDISTWARLLSQGNMVYIAEPLSYYRCHSGQEQQNFDTAVGGPICWAMEIKYAYKNKVFLKNSYSYRLAIEAWIIRSMEILRAIEKENLSTVESGFLWKILHQFVNEMADDA